MQDLNQKVKNTAKDLEDVKASLGLEEKKIRLRELGGQTTDPDFWKDREKAKKLMQELEHLKSELEEFENLEGEVSTLVNLVEEKELSDDFSKDVENAQERLEKFKLASFLSGQYDTKNSIVAIHAGQGGTEAMDWAQMLLRMYLRFCEKRGWSTETFDLTQGEEAGIKSVTFKVNGAYSYGYLKREAGTHRLVRQSPFNADRLRQTSFALVEVLPELEEADLPQIEIKEEDLEWQFFRSSSQGGQNVQKVSTAVRLRHKPTDVVVTAQSERYQVQNRKNALALLRAKLWLREEEMKQKKVKELKGEYRPASWGNQIRSYILHPYKMVKDLRTRVEVSDPDAVLDGELDEFIEAELKLV